MQSSVETEEVDVSPMTFTQVASWQQALGVVETLPDLVAWMVSLASLTPPRCRVLEPACGDCPFLAVFAENYGYHHELVGIDVDPTAVQRARQSLPFATIIEGDFLLWQPNERFDLVIGNPPYGIIGDASHYPIHVFKERKSLYRRRFKTWHGKFNIYGAFIEHAVNLLKPDGKLVFVVPASWLVLDDFANLRIFLAKLGRLKVYYVGKVFPRRNVSCVVLVLEKGKLGLDLHEGTTPVTQKPVYHGEPIRFETLETVVWERAGTPLGALFTIHFAARSPQVRSHPRVVTEPQHGYVPILTGRNLKAGWIDYETCYSGFWMPKEDAPSLLPFYAFPHIVVGHTKGTRVVAALDDRCYPWREEFHLVPKEGILTDLQTIVRYLNSELIQTHVKMLYRDLVPHLTMTMLKRVPIPPELAPPPKASQLTLWGSEVF